MKRLFFVTTVLLMISIAEGQTKLSIATDKTTSLVFPFPILHVDRGTKDILVQPVKEADNILLVKAGAAFFRPTNLSVFTNDGSVYSFMVSYESFPDQLVYRLPFLQKGNTESYANNLLDNPPLLHGIKDQSWGMHASVSGVYIKDNTLYFQLVLSNETAIDYDIEFLRFYIRDKKTGKRTAMQENELKPLCIAGNIKRVMAYSKNILVVALNQFTIPDAKYLAIEAGEKNGGRNLRLRMSNRKIIRAISLPEEK